MFLIAWTMNHGDNDMRDFWGVEADELTANNLLAFHMTHDKFHCGALLPRSSPQLNPTGRTGRLNRPASIITLPQGHTTMKIWTITTDQDGEGTATAVHTTETAARGAYARIIAASWESWFGANAAPMPDDTAKAWEVLTMQTGFMDSVTLTEHDIADHPAIAAAIEATALAETVIGKLANGDLNLHTEQGMIHDAYDAVADANCLLLGKMRQDDLAFGVSPDLQAAMERHEAAYRDAAKKHATDDLEFDDEPAVIFGDDEGAFVSCWKWITAAEAGLVPH